MLITLKTLQQKVFKVECELSDSVVSFKQKIQEVGKSDHNGDYPKEKQKLIFQGKILDDEKNLEEYQITEKGFIVLMLVKPKPQPKAEVKPKATSSPSTAAPSSAPVQPPAPAATTEPPTETAPPTTATTTPAAPPPPAPAPLENAALVEQLCSMGFERAQVEVALRAAFNNADRAVEYLTNGLPPNLVQQVAQPAAAVPTPAAAAPAVETPAAEGGAGRLSGSTLDRIRNEPQFQQIRQIIRTNPHLLQQFIEQLQRENPEIFQAITTNQADFVNMLNAGDDDDDEAADAPAAPGAPNIQEQDGRVTLEVTEQERQAIDRLKQLGFPEDLVVQAYFACEKNEELAANFLLQQMDFD